MILLPVANKQLWPRGRREIPILGLSGLALRQSGCPTNIEVTSVIPG